MALNANRYEVKNAVEPTPGNITEEKESELEEYADYAELILGVLGYKVFEPQSQCKSVATQVAPIVNLPTAAPKPVNKQGLSSNYQKPPLPSKSLKIGAFVRTAMTALSESGYVFEEDTINKMCTPEWAKKVFHTEKPFMRKYVSGETTTKDAAGYVRFWSVPFTFGSATVLISKEWYINQYSYFEEWYNTL